MEEGKIKKAVKISYDRRHGHSRTRFAKASSNFRATNRRVAALARRKMELLQLETYLSDTEKELSGKLSEALTIIFNDRKIIFETKIKIAKTDITNLLKKIK